MILDGWSTLLLLKEVVNIYEGACIGKELSLPSPTPFREYVKYLLKADRKGPLDFFKEYLKGFTRPTPIPIYKPRHLAWGEPENYKREIVKIPKEIYKDLKEFLNGKGLILKFMNEELLNSHLRITIGTEEQNRAVINAIKEFAENRRS